MDSDWEKFTDGQAGSGIGYLHFAGCAPYMPQPLINHSIATDIPMSLVVSCMCVAMSSSALGALLGACSMVCS